MSKFICIAEALEKEYPEVYGPLTVNLKAHGVNVRIVRNTPNVWTRDYMPLQVNGQFHLFNYADPARDLPEFDISSEPWKETLGPVIEHKDITLDGGNVIIGPGKVVLTHKVIEDNGKGVIKFLEKLFDPLKIIIVPVEPGDDLGHSDGIVTFINENNVLVNDYSGVIQLDKRFAWYQEKIEEILTKQELTLHHIFNAYAELDAKRCEENELHAFGYYINLLKVNDVLFLPAMQIEQDAAAFASAKQVFPDCDIIMVDCSRLSMDGGLVHCVTAGPYEE